MLHMSCHLAKTVTTHNIIRPRAPKKGHPRPTRTIDSAQEENDESPWAPAFASRLVGCRRTGLCCWCLSLALRRAAESRVARPAPQARLTNYCKDPQITQDVIVLLLFLPFFFGSARQRRSTSRIAAQGAMRSLAVEPKKSLALINDQFAHARPIGHLSGQLNEVVGGVVVVGPLRSQRHGSLARYPGQFFFLFRDSWQPS